MLGDIASIITVVLFIAYIIGRLWSLKKALEFMQEEFAVMNVDPDNEDIDVNEEELYFELIDDVDADDEREDGFEEAEERGEIISIKSKVSMLWFKVLRIPYDDEGNELPEGKAEPEIESEQPIRENVPIYIRTEIPEGYPTYRFRYQRADYIICSFDLDYNGRSGGMAPTNYKLKHTALSYLFYFFRS